jgi:hypothetical protein
MPRILLTVEADDLTHVDHMTRQLHIELRALDLDEIDFAGTPTPMADGSKGIDPATVSTIVVTVASSRVLVQLGRVLQDFVNRGRDRKIIARDGERSVEITGGNSRDNHGIVETFFESRRT